MQQQDATNGKAMDTLKVPGIVSGNPNATQVPTLAITPPDNTKVSTDTSTVKEMDTLKVPAVVHGIEKNTLYPPEPFKVSADTVKDKLNVPIIIVDADSPDKTPIGYIIKDVKKIDSNTTATLTAGYLELKNNPDLKDGLKTAPITVSVPGKTLIATKPKDTTTRKDTHYSQTANQLNRSTATKDICSATKPSQTVSSTSRSQLNADTEEKKPWIPPCGYIPVPKDAIPIVLCSGRKRPKLGTGYRVPEASEDETMDDDDDEGTFYECTRYPSPTRTLVPVRKPKQPDPYRIQCPQFISSLPYQPSRMPPRNTYGPKGGISFKSYQPCPATRGQSPYEPSTGAPLYGTPVKSKSPTSPPVSSSPYKYNIPASDCARRLIQTIMKNPTCPAYEALKKAAETPETATEDELYTGPTTTGDGSPKSFSSSPKSGGCNDDCLGKKKSTSGSPT